MEAVTGSRRRWLVGTLVLGVGAVLLALLHAPFSRRAVMELASDFLDSRYGVRIDTGELDYNLFTLDFELAELSLVRGTDTPFLRADRVHVDLPWSAVTGSLSFTAVEVDSTTLSLSQSAEGQWNLPASDSTEPGTSSPFVLPRIERLALTNVGISAMAPEFEVVVADLSLVLSSGAQSSNQLGGPLRVAQPIQIRRGDQRTTINALSAEVTLDSESLDLESFELAMPEGNLVVAGRILSPFAEPTLELTYGVDVAVDQAAFWWRPDHPLDGDVSLTGTVAGPIADPRVTVELNAPRLHWDDLSPLSVHGVAIYDAGVVVVDSATVTYDTANLDASGRLALGTTAEPSRFEASWRDLDTAKLVRELGLDLPYTPGGRISGSGNMTWTEWDSRSFQVEAEITSRMLADRVGIVPFEGTSRLDASDGQWQVELDRVAIPGLRVSGHVRGSLAGSDGPLTDSRLEGTIAADAHDLAQIAQTLALPGLVGNEAAPGLSGTAAAAITLSGTVAAPTVTGRIADASIGFRGIDGIGLRSRFATDLRRVSLDALTASLGTNLVRGALQLDLDTDSVDGLLDAELRDVSALAPVLPPALAPTGSLDVHLSISGRLGTPNVDGEIAADDLTLAGRALDRMTGRVSLGEGVLNIASLEAHQESGRLGLRGSYVLADGTYELALTARDLSLAALAAASPDESSLHGQMELDVTSSGSLSNFTARGTARIDSLAWAGRSFGSADITLDLNEGALSVEADVPSLNASGQGRFGLVDDTSFNLAVDLQRMPFERLLGPTADETRRLDVSGVGSLRATATGDLTALLDSQITLELVELDGRIGTTRLQLSDPGTLRYSDRTLATERLELRLGDTQVALFGSLSDTASQITATVTGELSDLAPLLELARAEAENQPPVDLDGSVDALILLTGSLDAPDLSAQLQLRDGAVAVGTFSPAENLDVDLSYDMQTVRLDRLTGTWQGAVVDGAGELPVALLGDLLPSWLARSATDRPVARLTLTADAISVETLAPFIDPASLGDLDIRSSAQLDIEASGLEMEQVRAELRLSQLDMTVAGVPITQRRATHLDLVDGQLHVRSFDWGNDDDYLTVGGMVDLRGDTAIDLTITGEGDLRAISAFTTGIATEGDALLIANVTGPLSEPVVNGVLELSGAGLRLTDPQLVVSDVTGALFLTHDSIQFHDFTGEANGGPLEITGALDLVGLRPQGDIRVLGRGLAMNIPEGARTEIDADLTLTVSADDLELDGTVTVLRGAYRETLTLTGGVLAALQAQESVTIVGLDQPSVLDGIGLNIRVLTAEDIVIDNNYADASIGFDLRVVGTAGTPALTGRATLGEGGRLQLGSRVYEVETGTVDFIDPTGIEPELDITARTWVSGRDISVTITGVPEALTMAFQSDPVESESDIVSLLLTGRTLDQVGVAPQTAAAEQALGLVSTEFLGSTGRAVGLDTLRIGQDTSSGQIRFDSSLVASETDPGARLTVGKNLSDQVQVIASQDLVDSGQLTWIIEYLPRSNVELRLVLDDLNDRSYEFRHALALGGPVRRLGAATTARRAIRVEAIEFTGELGLPESELRSRLDLRAGDQFDFFRWQRDRDELERLYAERDYLEARVRPQRVETADGGSILTYRIIRGPRSQLTIEGYQLPQDVVDQMKDAWTRAVFDGFLLEELETRARDYLGDNGFLQSDITAEVRASGAERKEIVLRIDSGPRTNQRELVFRGNDRLTTGELRAFIERQGLEQSAWADPDPLITSVLSLYQSRGMLEARVTAEPPVFDAVGAILAVIVVEGPLFTIASVSIEGVDARPAATVQSVVRLDVGDIYSGLDVSDARARIDQSYRQAGFNEVHASARSTVDLATDTVTVVFEIDEGPRQVIREIEVVGGEHTQASLVSRALRISPGQPVDLGEWNQARKRLYDTGAFRSVDIEAQALDPETAEPETGEQPVRAAVFLEEWPAYRLRYGLQVRDEELPLGAQSRRDVNLGLVGDLTRQNFTGRAVTLGTAFRWDRDRRVVRGFARVPSFFGLPITSNVFVAQEHRTFGDPDFLTATDQTLLTLEQRLRPRPSMTIAYGYSFDRNHTFDVDPDPGDPFGGFDETINIARLTAGAIIDTRNDLFDATRGWFHSSNVEYAPDALGSQLRFIKYSGQQFHYWPLGSEVVIASAARIGLAAGFDQDLILSERFFAGGANTVRGYRQDSLGPLFFGQPDGGNALIVLNQEVRFPIFGIVRGVGFLDAGNVFSLIEDFALTNLKVGAGIGLRLDTPFGLFRFDFAAPLSEIEENRKSRFFFSIGQVF